MINNTYIDVVLQPFFIEGSKGRLFCLFSPPKNEQMNTFIFLPSFAEEMNRCRVMVAMQARMLVAQGHGCLLLDYYGTGDSEGDFSDTTWEQWQSDALAACQWIINQNQNRIVLWGVRLGALMAVELANQQPELFSRLLFWQPVLDAQSFLTQFFRIRVAMLMDRGEPKETTQQMRAQLQQGNNLEIAGYSINPKLVETLDSKKISSLKDTKIPIDWFEVIMDADGDISPAGQKVINDWRQRSISVRPHCYQGPAFWQLHERELTPDLLEKTTALFI
jgi:exosortase A-associated hydrolase 2